MIPGAASIRAAGWARRRGFTLLELVVVLAIAGLLMALTPPLLSKAMPGMQLKSATRQIAGALREARDRAVSRREQAVVELDVERREIGITGRTRTVTLSDSLELILATAERELANEQTGRIRFFPDGTSTGGRVTVRYDQRGYDVDVDWLTGAVRVQELTEPGT